MTRTHSQADKRDLWYNVAEEELGETVTDRGGSRGAGGSMPPPSLACAIFLRVVVGVQTYHAAYSQAFCQQNC